MPRICHALQLAFSKIWLTVSSCVSLSSALWLTGLLPRGHPPFPATSRELVTGNSEVEHMTANPQSLLCTLRPRLCNQRLKVRGTYWIKQFIHSPLSVIRQIAMESVYPGAAPRETHPRCRTARGETSSPLLRSFHSPRNTNMPSPCPPEYCRRFNWQSDRKAQKLCKLSRNERKGEKKEGEDFITVSGKNYWSLNFCTPLWDNGLWVCMQFIKCRKKQQLVSPTSVSCGSSQESKIKISARSVLFPQYLLGDRQCY